MTQNSLSICNSLGYISMRITELYRNYYSLISKVIWVIPAIVNSQMLSVLLKYVGWICHPWAWKSAFFAYRQRKQNILPDTEESWELEDVAETIIDLLKGKICY